jgi:hypothetical protein
MKRAAALTVLLCLGPSQKWRGNPGLPEITAPLRNEPRRDDKKVIGLAPQFVGEPIFASIKMAPVKTSGNIC